MAANKKVVSGTVYFTHNNQAKSAGFTTTFTRLSARRIKVAIKVNTPGGRTKTYTADWPDPVNLPPNEDGRKVVLIYARDVLPGDATFKSVK